jgi:hypothetical protein
VRLRPDLIRHCHPSNDQSSPTCFMQWARLTDGTLHILPQVVGRGYSLGVIKADVIGVEVAARIGSASPYMFHERGYHGTPGRRTWVS